MSVVYPSLPEADFEPTITDLPMNNVVSVVNTYNISLSIQAALSYPMNTLLSDLSRPHTRPKDIAFIDAVHEDIARRGMPSPPTKSLDFRGFVPSKLVILRGGNSHVRRFV